LFSAGVGHVEFGMEGGGAVNTAVHCAVHEVLLLASSELQTWRPRSLEIFSLRINELHGTFIEVMNS